MKKIITLSLLLFSLMGFSQEVEVGDKIKINDDTQKGVLVYNGVKFVQNGIWKSNYAKAEYVMGKLRWIHPKGNRKWTTEEITIAQLRNRVIRLEESIASTDN
jgi:hypothetical protein